MSVSLPPSGYAEFINNLVRQHHVAYRHTGLTVLARDITRLSDDVVEQDEVERQVVALRKAGVINGREMLKLLQGYLRESLDV